MNVTRRPRYRTAARKANSNPPRPIPELLLEIAYHLHTTKVLARPGANR
jgi:hypothetical protein